MKQRHQPARKISKTAEIVDAIAFRTDILALHAAVRAGGCGEAGVLAHLAAQPATRTVGPIDGSTGKLSPAAAERQAADLARLANVLRPSPWISEGPEPSPVRNRKFFPRSQQEDTV